MGPSSLVTTNQVQNTDTHIHVWVKLLKKIEIKRRSEKSAKRKTNKQTTGVGYDLLLIRNNKKASEKDQKRMKKNFFNAARKNFLA